MIQKIIVDQAEASAAFLLASKDKKLCNGSPDQCLKSTIIQEAFVGKSQADNVGKFLAQASLPSLGSSPSFDSSATCVSYGAPESGFAYGSSKTGFSSFWSSFVSSAACGLFGACPLPPPPPPPGSLSTCDQACAQWLKQNWTTLTGALESEKNVLQEVVKGYISGQFAPSSSSVDDAALKKYSVGNFLSSSGYPTAEDAKSAQSYIQLMDNAAQIPTLFLPSANVLKYTAGSTCDLGDTSFFSKGKVYGGLYSAHSAGFGKPGGAFRSNLLGSGSYCKDLPSPNQAQRLTVRNKVYEDIKYFSHLFHENRRKLTDGKNLFLDSLKDAFVRRSKDLYVSTSNPTALKTDSGKAASDRQASVRIRPDWRTVSSSAYGAHYGKVWRDTINKSPPSVVRRETLYALTDILASLYQTELIEERMLLAYAYQGLQTLSGSGLVGAADYYKRGLEKNIYQYATGSTELSALKKVSISTDMPEPAASDAKSTGKKQAKHATSKEGKKIDNAKSPE